MTTLAETARHNFQSFEETISSIMDGSFDDYIGTVLQVKCRVIRMDAEIAMAFYPERNKRCLNLYYGRISKCLLNIIALESFADELQLKQLGMVYLKLNSLAKFIRELLIDEMEK